MTSLLSNEKAASKAALVIHKFNWRHYRRHFLYYWGFLTIGAFLRASHPDLVSMLAANVLSVPLASIAAWFAMRQKPYVEGDPIPKPRIWKSIGVGLAICAVVVGFCLALKQG